MFNASAKRFEQGPTDNALLIRVQSCERNCDDFGGLVMRNGSALDMVSAARVDVRVWHRRALTASPHQIQAHVTVTVALTDDRRRNYPVADSLVLTVTRVTNLLVDLEGRPRAAPIQQLLDDPRVTVRRRCWIVPPPVSSFS